MGSLMDVATELRGELLKYRRELKKSNPDEAKLNRLDARVVELQTLYNEKLAAAKEVAVRRRRTK